LQIPRGSGKEGGSPKTLTIDMTFYGVRYLSLGGGCERKLELLGGGATRRPAENANGKKVETFSP